MKGIVDLYRQASYSQVKIVQITRAMRDEGKKDEEIIAYLGLKDKVPFVMDREYLRQLFAFITSRKPKDKDNMYTSWLAYHTAKINPKCKMSNS